MTALDELRAAIDALSLNCMTPAYRRAEVLGATRLVDAALARVDAELAELDHILASMDVPHALNGRMQPLSARAQSFVERSDRLAAVEAELVALRETNMKLNRRCQSAERGLAARLTSGPSFGRALANAAATMYHEQLAERNAELAALRKRPTLEQAEAALRGASITDANGDAWPFMRRVDVYAAICALYGEQEPTEVRNG